jgi:hypothetical protein
MGCEDELKPTPGSDAASADYDMGLAADSSVPVLDIQQCDVVVDRSDGVISDGVDRATVRDTQGLPLRGYRVGLLVSGARNFYVNAAARRRRRMRQ